MKRKSFRLPNGYGSVVHLSGNRRRPYWARITAGYNDKGQQIYKSIGYYATREEALIELAKYNNSPYDLDLANLTFEGLYKLWSESVLPRMGKSLQGAHRASYGHCTQLYPLKYRSIRAMQFQRVIDECEKSYATKANIRNLFVALDAFAYDNDIIVKAYSANLSVPEATPKEGKLFTKDEIVKVWSDGDDVCRFLLFTGMRISEALELTPDDVDLQEQTILCGMKTSAGKNRIVPIHPMIRGLVERRMAGKYLFPHDGKKQTYKAYTLRRFNPMMERLGMEHHTHDCRKTFRSALDKAGANKVAVDRIVGHKSGDVGERVYTLKTLDELREAINLLDYGLSVPLGK